MYMNIYTLEFCSEKLQTIKSLKYGVNWPVVYLINDKQEIYVGETQSMFRRAHEHIKNVKKNKLNNLHIINDSTFNMSVTKDIESSLISYFSGDGKYIVQNSNSGMLNAEYYNKEKYQHLITDIWDLLIKNGLVKNTIQEIENSKLFKYSPYKTLNSEQNIIATEIISLISENEHKNIIINGEPGTGKSILAIYLAKYIKDEFPDKKIAVVIQPTPLRKTIKNVFSTVKNLSAGMVIGPSEVLKNDYDIIIVDEAHRLKRGIKHGNRGVFDRNNRMLGNESYTELDWILTRQATKIFLYDKDQAVSVSDVEPYQFEKIASANFYLTQQMRIDVGSNYVKFIKQILSNDRVDKINLGRYDLKLYEYIEELIYNVKRQDNIFGLCRLVTGYGFEKITDKRRQNVPRIPVRIDNTEINWPTQFDDWINSENSINEIGTIHNIQGYDLNYVGVVIGPEVSYNETERKVCVNFSKVLQKNALPSKNDWNESEAIKYIINTYVVLLTRGIKGCYIYCCDKSLHNYFNSQLL